MKQEDKIQLLKDLYAKSLYGIHCCVYNLNGTIREEDDIIYYCADTNVVTLKSTEKKECYMYYQIKPYLQTRQKSRRKGRSDQHGFFRSPCHKYGRFLYFPGWSLSRCFRKA